VVRHAEVVEWKQPVPVAPSATGQPGLPEPMPTTPTAKSKDPALALPLAGWWRRFGSGIMDTVISWVLTIAMMAIVNPDFLPRWWSAYMAYSQEIQQGLLTGQITMPSTAFQAATSTLMLTAGAVTAVYCIVFLGTWGATLGHRLAGIKVVRAPLPPSLAAAGTGEFTEEKPGWLRAVSKGLGWALFSTGGGVFSLVQIVNVLLPLWHRRKQSVTDLFASTLIIRNLPTKKDA